MCGGQRRWFVGDGESVDYAVQVEEPVSCRFPSFSFRARLISVNL